MEYRVLDDKYKDFVNFSSEQSIRVGDKMTITHGKPMNTVAVYVEVVEVEHFIRPYGVSTTLVNPHTTLVVNRIEVD